MSMSSCKEIRGLKLSRFSQNQTLCKKQKLFEWWLPNSDFGKDDFHSIFHYDSQFHIGFHSTKRSKSRLVVVETIWFPEPTHPPACPIMEGPSSGPLSMSSESILHLLKKWLSTMSKTKTLDYWFIPSLPQEISKPSRSVSQDLEIKTPENAGKRIRGWFTVDLWDSPHSSHDWTCAWCDLCKWTCKEISIHNIEKLQMLVHCFAARGLRSISWFSICADCKVLVLRWVSFLVAWCFAHGAQAPQLSLVHYENVSGYSMLLWNSRNSP